MHGRKSGEWGNVFGLGVMLASLLYFVSDMKTAGVVMVIVAVVGAVLVYQLWDRPRNKSAGPAR